MERPLSSCICFPGPPSLLRSLVLHARLTSNQRYLPTALLSPIVRGLLWCFLAGPLPVNRRAVLSVLLLVLVLALRPRTNLRLQHLPARSVCPPSSSSGSPRSSTGLDIPRSWSPCIWTVISSALSLFPRFSPPAPRPRSFTRCLSLRPARRWRQLVPSSKPVSSVSSPLSSSRPNSGHLHV